VRDAFFRALTEAADDERVWALTGDLGIGLFDEFERRARGRYLNVGIAEQNLVGVAAGLAYAGKIPFAYSIAPFLTSRAHDQIRVDVAMGRANVKLVGVGGGVAYGSLGPTHHAIEDVALMRALPGMTVLAPGDPGEAERATRAALDHDGPVYLRLGKNGEAAVLPDEPFRIGPARLVRRGGDVTLACSGTMLAEAVAAAERLDRTGIAATVLHFPTVKPLDVEAVVLAAERTRSILAVEEHSVVGGLGSAIAEVVAEHGLGVRVRRLGVPDRFAPVGSRSYVLARYGLSPDAIAGSAYDLVCGRLAA
jgi:transketolase